MIKFKNGHQFQFVTASGALAFNGDGWWFEQPWRWFNILRPQDFTIITKTVTFLPRVGKYVWWRPWECFRFIQDGCVNAFALTNRGRRYWIEHDYPHIQRRGYKVIASVMPDSVAEAIQMARELNECKDIVGVELNVSCPNVDHHTGMFHICNIVVNFCDNTDHPVVLKLGYDQPYLDICTTLDNHPKVEAFDLINAVPWDIACQGKKSPLMYSAKAKGAVSGRKIVQYGRKALSDVKNKCRTPVISGGGIHSYDEVITRLKMGADAISLGTIMWSPFLVNRIIKSI